VIGYAPRALSDLERLCDFLAESDPGARERTVDLILTAIAVLEQHPLIGRPVESGLRELVISRGKSGYLALYRYDDERDRVLVLTIRHQREAGYVE
jgi:plasmid stabilization system protein ParE